MKPVLKIELEEQNQEFIESGSLVIDNARIGQVTTNPIKYNESHHVFNFGLSKIETWSKKTTRLFKGTIIMKQ